jgi:hypothetical protein
MACGAAIPLGRNDVDDKDVASFSGHFILQPLFSTVPAISAPLTMLVTVKQSSGASPLACASPT